MPRLRLDISYEGTDFVGWALQAGQRSVCGVLTDALATILRVPVRLTVAGRTDSGVHATSQVAHCDVSDAVWHDFSSSLLRRLGGFLPVDLRVRAVSEVSEDFDARFSALRRHYRYRIADRADLRDPLTRRFTLWWPRVLDVILMNEAAAHLLGEHDFAAFCRKREGATTIRALSNLFVRRDDSGLVLIDVSADAFCHSMVRSLVGALLPVGLGQQGPQWPAALLSQMKRAENVTVAPAHGLTLIGVDYPPDNELAARAVKTRNLRGLSSPR